MTIIQGGQATAIEMSRARTDITATKRAVYITSAAATPNLTLEQKAAMDEATYSGTGKSGDAYVITTATETLTANGSGGSEAKDSKVTFVKITTTQSGTISSLATNIQTAAGSFRMALYTDAAGVPGTLLNESSSIVVPGTGWVTATIPATAVVASSSYWIAAQYSTAVCQVYFSAGSDAYENQAYGAFPATATSSAGNGANMRAENAYLLTTGTIKSAAIAKNVDIGLRYWGDICANLVAGAAGSTIKAKICDSAGTALHSNFVTIAASEYARIPLMRPVALTATSGSQTVWNFTSLSNADAFINELGVLAKAILVELALDGSTYSVLEETTDYTEDISNILAPKITLVSGTGVISGTSKLRATYIVNVALSNTTIKLQIQLNRVASGDTSPSITPLVGDATKYVSAGQVVVI